MERADADSGITLEIERKDAVAVVTVHGRLAQMAEGKLEHDLFHQIEQGVRTLVIDLSDVPFITSSGLGVFMAAYKQVVGDGGSVRLVQPQPLVRQILDTTKLTKLFRLYDSVEDALAAD